MAGIEALAVRGPARGVTGYAHHTRAIVRELARAGVALEISELEGWVRPEEPEADSDPVPAAQGGGVRPPIVLHCGMPPQAARLADVLGGILEGAGS